jgi:hypothetical protein
MRIRDDSDTGKVQPIFGVVADNDEIINVGTQVIDDDIDQSAIAKS